VPFDYRPSQIYTRQFSGRSWVPWNARNARVAVNLHATGSDSAVDAVVMRRAQSH